MKRLILLLVPLCFAAAAPAQDLVVDDFESYTDDTQVTEAWVFSKAGGDDGLFTYLDQKNTPPQGKNCMLMDVNMPAKWWYNKIKYEFSPAPLDLTKYNAVEFQLYGDSTVVAGNLAFVVFLYDSGNRVLRFQVPDTNVVTASWQKITLSIDGFLQETWDDGYGTDTPDADKNDITAFGLMVVGNEDNQAAKFYVDNVKFIKIAEVSPESGLDVDNFESYTDDAQVTEAWVFSKAGGDDGLFTYLDQKNTPPQGKNCMLMDVNMPAKWWYNKIKHEFSPTPLDLTKYNAVEFQLYGDSTVVAGNLAFVVFLYDSGNRVLRFQVPDANVVTAAWQKITISLDNFIQETWDDGYGTDTPDANKNDITALGLMVVGNEDNQVGKFYVDNIRFVKTADVSTLSGKIMEGEAPLSDVTVYAITQSAITTVKTDAAGAYQLNNLIIGKTYRIIPAKKDYDFTPGLVNLTIANSAYTQDFTGSPSIYNGLEKAAIQDPFDESGLNPAIIYRYSRDWGPAGPRPVIDVTQDKTFTVNFPDAAGGDATMYAIPQNSLSGATSPKFAVEVGSFYGWDMMVFGRNTDSNYYVEVDVYCDVRYDIVPGFDRISLGARCNPSDPGKPALDAYGDSDAYWTSGGYALTYETDMGEIYARKYAASNDKAHVISRTEGFATDYAKVTLTESGWHRFRIECLNNSITFFVDGNKIAETQDTDYAFGPAGLHYRACYSDSLTDLVKINHARFDNLKAGPTGSSVGDWMLN